MAATKRKRAALDTAPTAATNGAMPPPPPIKRRSSSRNTAAADSVNPDLNHDIIDAPNATRASPDNAPNNDIVPQDIKTENGTRSESPLSDAPEFPTPPEEALPEKKKGRGKQNATAKAGTGKGNNISKVKKEQDAATVGEDAGEKNTAPKKQNKKAADDTYDPEAEGEEDADPEEVKQALSRPPPVHSDYLPLPWKGRLGYACLNTYLRQSNPPVFSSRTCRIQSILEHRHPLQNPDEPEHSTKNRPDRSKPADFELGKKYLEAICLANVEDIKKMVRWNDRYGIKFMRLSSEMFPFASHPEYGYQLAPFAAEALADAGKVIAQYGHRVTTHPGQFTQLGSPRRQVIDNAIRDLAYHDELLSLLSLPEQQNKDAVMIIHMGGVFEDKQATIQRFRDEYVKLPQSIKNRVVLENDDVSYSVHDLLPVCEELNIPFVLDYHHHNIIFDASQIREGTRDIMDLYPRILATWQRKGITPKMHYSEPTPPAITGRQRRKHSPRVMTLPPCPDTMDLMIEAKDKEQAVFELMRTFKLPGYHTFNDITPYVRDDDNKAALQQLNKKKKKSDEPEPAPALVPDDEVGMGGPHGRVYWPPGMEEWLRPKKREVKAKEPKETKSKDQVKEEAARLYAARQAKVKEEEHDAELESDVDATPATKKAKAAMRKKERADDAKAAAKAEEKAAKEAAKLAVKQEKEAVKEEKVALQEQGAKKGGAGGRKQTKKKQEAPPPVPTPSPSDSPNEPDEAAVKYEDDSDVPLPPAAKRRATAARKTARGGRAAKRVSYAEDEESDELLE